MADLIETRPGCQPRLTTTAHYRDVENDKAQIRAGDRTQRALTNRDSGQMWFSYLTIEGYKRARRSGSTMSRRVTDQTLVDPPTYVAVPTPDTEAALRRLMRRFTRKQTDPSFDPATIGVLTKRQQKRARRKAEKEERRQHEALTAYQNKQIRDEVSRQLEVNERKQSAQRAASDQRISLRKTVKKAVSKTKRIARRTPTETNDISPPVPTEALPQPVPTLDDFESKQQLGSYFSPSAVEAVCMNNVIHEASPEPCELPADAESSTSVRSTDHHNDMVKTRHYLGQNAEVPHAVSRSASPCFSSTVPRRGITISEAPAHPAIKQMQCDCCYEHIKMTSYYYACDICDQGDRIYCSKCANDGSTCRHELEQKTRAIKRYPTNPQYTEQRSMNFDRDPISPVTTLQQIEQSPSHLHNLNFRPSVRTQPLSTPHEQPAVPAQDAEQPDFLERVRTSHSSSAPQPALDFLKEFEAKRREQDVAFREKEVTLREREAMLREREMMASSREREAAMMQQLHATAILRQEKAAEVGAQFAASVSRQSSCCTAEHALSRHPTSATSANNIILEPAHDRKKNEAALETVMQLLEQANLNHSPSHNGIQQRGASTGSNKHGTTSTQQGNTQGRRAEARRNGSNRRPSSKRSTDGTGDEDDDNNGGASPKRPRYELPITNLDRKLFACPYCKHDPNRYSERNTNELSYRNCASGLYRDISRVKQHLKRVHHMPESYCRRCFEVFPGESELDEHMSQQEACQAQECPFPERIDQKKQAKIHVKRPGKNPEALWYEIYSVIFPGAEPPSSPYVESSQPRYTNRNTIGSFIELLERKLDNFGSSAHQGWTQDFASREWLRQQMNSAMLELMQQMSLTSGLNPADVPSVLVSPVSPTVGHSYLQSRQSSQSSSPSVHRQRRQDSTVAPPLLCPEQTIKAPSKPSLKVTTRGMSSGSVQTSRSSASQGVSANSVFSNVQIPQHVQDDLGYDQSSSSWRSGDDQEAMVNIDTLQEPSSATSTTSRKSVSFATPPQVPLQAEPVVSTNSSWNTALLFDSTQLPFTSPVSDSYWPHPVYNQQPDAYTVQEAQLESRKNTQGFRARTDSAYETLSSKPSHSSISEHEMTAHPQQVFVNPKMVMNDTQMHTDMMFDGTNNFSFLFPNPQGGQRGY